MIDPEPPEDDVRWVYAQLCSMTLHPNLDITAGQRPPWVHDARRDWARTIARHFRCSEPNVETIAAAFHSRYERLAPTFGYQTRPESAVSWPDVPEQNRRLMIATVEHLVAMGLIR